MQCLRCSKDTLPGKALCAECFEQHQQRFGEERIAEHINRVMNQTGARIVSKSTEGAPAGFWLRFFAFYIDIVCSVIVVKLGALIGQLLVANVVSLERTLGGECKPEMLMAIMLGAVMLTVVVTLMFSSIYSVLLESSRWQGGIGKRLFRIKVVNSKGERISILHAVGRAIAHKLPVLGLLLLTIVCIMMKSVAAIVVISLLGSILIVVQYLMAAFTSRKQALHDMIANTYVVRYGEPLVGLNLAWRVALSLIIIVALSIISGDPKLEQKIPPAIKIGER